MQKLNSIADTNMNDDSNTSTSNLSSAASFDGEPESTEQQLVISEPVISSASSLQRKYKNSLLNSQNSGSGSQKSSLENLNLNDENNDLVLIGKGNPIFNLLRVSRNFETKWCFQILKIFMFENRLISTTAFSR